MPYIPEERRVRLDDGATPERSGELNYTITSVVEDFLMEAAERHGREVPTYAMFAAAISALECAKLELYRRAVAPYEDEKVREHGDIGLYGRVRSWAHGQYEARAKDLIRQVMGGSI